MNRQNLQQLVCSVFLVNGSPPFCGSILSSVSLKVVAEFTVSTSAPATAGVRAEQTALLATEDSYKHYGPNAAPPKLLVNTVIPKSAGAKYGFNGVEGGLHAAAPAISKQYHIREQGLLVVEDLAGSRFINWIPRQILEVIIRYRAKELLIAESDLARLEAYDRLRLKGSDQKNPNTLSHWPQLSTKNRLFPDRSILNILSPLNEHHVKNMLGMKALQFTTSTIEL
ncbi:unnamed protein product [Hyaloperonospora brassicae]|uniref:RxLR effector candidate protein n=1 Tax=Hyaloperonospora brassicae TaxID=162125 RepID=A0AAV0TBG7_HYABA|nr:unnamed protein product [Hyaloperonospora brassicae]